DLAIAEKLAAADPKNAEWQRDLSVSYNKLGDVAVAAGKLDEGRTAFERGLAIAQKLAAADPTNAEWQRDLAISHVKLIGVARQRRDRADAQRHLAAALAVLAETDRRGLLQGDTMTARIRAFLASQ